jgi:hypothetical protein
MIPLSSRLNSRELVFGEIKNRLSGYDFSIGGNWDYKSGSFDRPLDGEAQKVWLRLPFEVINGDLDAETDNDDALIRFEQPFVLKHVYNEGLEQGVSPGMMGGLVNQFQHPTDPDASVEQIWIDKAEQVLRQVEGLFAD